MTKVIRVIVSILVLLEVSLRLDAILIAPTKSALAGFNPCFIGSISEASRVKGCGLENMRFNPCFIGSISEAQEEVSSMDIELSFNPCFIGSISEA